jgi:anti-sigma factor RsiW
VSHHRVRLSALVDGELDHEVRDRLLAHLAQCDECRAAVENERRVKALLGGLSDARPAEDFTARLRQIALPPEFPPDFPPEPLPGSLPGSLAPPPAERRAPEPVHARVTRPSARMPRSPVPAGPLRPYHHPAAWTLPGGSGRPAGSRPGARGTRPLVVGFAGAASFAGMALVTAFTVGGQPPPTEADVKPPIERYTVQHSNRAVELPWSDPGAVTASFNEGRFGSAVFGSGRR